MCVDNGTVAEVLREMAGYARVPSRGCPDCGREDCMGEDCYWPDEAGVRRPERLEAAIAAGEKES